MILQTHSYSLYSADVSFTYVYGDVGRYTHIVIEGEASVCVSELHLRHNLRTLKNQLFNAQT